MGRSKSQLLVVGCEGDGELDGRVILYSDGVLTSSEGNPSGEPRGKKLGGHFDFSFKVAADEILEF